LSREEYLAALRKEQAAFEGQLEDLVAKHSHKLVVFHGGALQGVFADYGKAYAFAIERFGLDEPFLIAPVEPPRIETISVAWDSGVMFA